MRARLLELVGRGLDAPGIADGLLADVRAFAHGDLRADDVTIVVARRVQ